MEIKETEAEAEAVLKGQAEIGKCMLCFCRFNGLKMRRRPSITRYHQLSLLPDLSLSDRLLHFRRRRLVGPLLPPPHPATLVRRNIFAAHHSQDDGGGGETLYGLTHSSKWLLHKWMVEPWLRFSQGVQDGGGDHFRKAHGRDIWEFASENPQFNQLFNNAMASTSKVVMNAILSVYKDGFDSVRSLADVGGGIGGAVSEIVKASPHIQGINYDLPHVICKAPPCQGVIHVGGDMFQSIPKADAVFMKWILHDWDDEKCVRILKNCKKAIPAKLRKVIIVEVILKPNGDDPFDDTQFYFDLLMLAHSNGKERTEEEWKIILEQAGFGRYKVVAVPGLTSIIEAYPSS